MTGIRTARVRIIYCGLFAATWVLLIRSYIFAGSLGAGMIMVAASFLLIPIATVFALTATVKLFASHATDSNRKRSLSDVIFLAAGVVLSVAGTALCLRIAYGMVAGG